MDRDIVSRILVISVKGAVQSLYIVVKTRPRNTGDGNDADGVLVTHLQRRLGIQRRMLERDGHGTQLDLPQLAELLPHDLVGGAHHQIGLVVGFALLLAFGTPPQPRRHAAQHTRLRRSDTHGTGLPCILLGRMPQVGKDVYATAAHNSHTRILRLVDVVDVDGVVHQLRGIVVHIGGDEGRKVQPRLCLRVGLVLDHTVGDFGSCLVLRDKFRRCGREHLLRSVHGGLGCSARLFSLICFHRIRF